MDVAVGMLMVSVKHPWRSRSLAKALIARSLQVFKDRGTTEAVTGVDKENPSEARNLYKKMGFKVEKRTTFYREAIDFS